MGLRKRRKKLTTLLTSIDRRLRSVESTTVPTRIARKVVTAAEIAPGVVPSSDPKDGGATGSTSSSTTPVEFAIVTAATYSSKDVTGSTDWMDVTTSTNHNLAKGDKVTIYGLNNNLVSGNGTFTVSEVVSSTEFRYSPKLNGFYSSAVTMNVSATVISRSRTTTTATLKLSNTTHGYIVGDVITVSDIPNETSYNGTFFVKSVSGDTITYDFVSELSSSEAITTSAGTIHSVIHKYAIIGDTWIDTSVTPNLVKVWNGLIWTDTSNIPAGVIVDDHMAPSAPTNLSATQNGYYSGGSPKVAVKLSWTAPTTNADGSNLRDLAGYKVFYKYIKGADSTGSAGNGSTNTTTNNTNGTINGTFKWSANDQGSSVVVSLSTNVGTVHPSTYTIPADGGSKSLQWTISGLGQDEQATLSWTTPSSGSGDITAAAGSTTIISHNEVRAANWRADIFGYNTIEKSTQPTAIDPVNGGPSTASADWQAGPDTDQTTASIDNINSDAELQFAVQAYDSSKKNFSTYSSPLTVVTGKPALVLNAPSKPSVSVRLGTATVTWDGNDNSGSIPPKSLSYVEVHIGSTSGFTPGDTTYKGTISATSGSDGNFLVVDGLTYNSTWYAKFIAVSSNDVKTAASVASDQFTITPLVDTDLIANTLTNWPFVGGVVDAGALANGAVSARTLAQNAITSSNITNVISPGAISTGLIAANAIGADQIAAGAIIAGKLAANSVTTNSLAANAITAGKIDANAITADKISAGAITAVKLSVDAIDGKVITGATVRTAASGARVQMDTSGIAAYNSSGTQTFRIDSSNGSVMVGGYATQGSLDAANAVVANKISTGGAASDINYNTTTIDGGKITANSISVNSLVAGELVGFTIKTATSGDRMELNKTNTTYYSSSGVSGTVSAGAYGYLVTAGNFTMYCGNNVFYVEVSTNNYIHYSTTSGFEFYTTGTYGISIQSGKGLYSAGPNWFDGSIKYVGRPGSATAGSPIHVRTTGSGADLLFEYVSSREYKSDIKDLDMDYEKFMTIPIKSFAYNEDYELHGENAMRIYGYIAEDIEDAGYHDLVVYKDLPDGTRKPHSLAFHSLNAITQAIVNKQAATIKDLEARIALLENK